MNVKENISGTTAVLTLVGDFWKSGDWALYEKVKTLIDGGLRHIVVDFSDINRINSIAIGVLVASLKTLREVGGDLAVSGANNDVQSVLKIVNLYAVIPICDTVDEALAALAAN